jgi:hypothetical protein
MLDLRPRAQMESCQFCIRRSLRLQRRRILAFGPPAVPFLGAVMRYRQVGIFLTIKLIGAHLYFSWPGLGLCLVRTSGGEGGVGMVNSIVQVDAAINKMCTVSGSRTLFSPSPTTPSIGLTISAADGAPFLRHVVYKEVRLLALRRKGTCGRGHEGWRMGRTSMIFRD